MALSLLTPPRALRYVSASLAAALDRALFSPTYAFPPAVLIELSGLAIAQIVAREYPRHTYPCVLVAAGPGNQGADGLAAARHLRTWGWKIAVWAPRLKGDSEVRQRRGAGEAMRKRGDAQEKRCAREAWRKRGDVARATRSAHGLCSVARLRKNRDGASGRGLQCSLEPEKE
jgi:NAD(P)H-hydrate repair Nnr-like enzyme with NAD(P)H-hydrate epimerase domain